MKPLILLACAALVLMPLIPFPGRRSIWLTPLPRGFGLSSGSIVSAKDVQRIVNAWSGDELVTVAAASAAAFRQADPKTPAERAESRGGCGL